MKTKTQLTTWTIFLIFVLCLSLVNVNTVLADDTPPTEPPAATEQPTELPTEEATPLPEVTPVPLESDLTGDVAELLSEIPDNTDIVILDENGNPIPLASQAAADIIQEEDPLWCPVGAPLNSPLCRNFTGGSAITNMLTDMRNNTGTYDENGVIYFTSTAGGSLALTNVAASLSTDFALLSTFNLTLTGGWNGNLSSPVFSGQTSFGSNTLTIGTVANPWSGNLTLNNFVFSNVNDTPGVQIYTTNGSVTLNNVDLSNTDDATSINVVTGTGAVNLTGVDIQNGTDGNGINVTTNSGSITLADVDVTNQQDGYTANLLSQSGNIIINNGSSNGSSFDGGNDSLGFVATTNTGSITMTGASGSGNQITFTDAEGSNGATLSAPIVALTQVTANNNDLNGIQISNANTITLNNVISTNNGTEVTGPDLGSGVRIFGTGITTVNVTGGTYSNNERYGIEMSNVSSITTTGVTFSGNGEGNIVNDNTAPTISPSFSCSLLGNAGWCRGTITINWNVVDLQSAVNTTGCQTSFNTNTSSAGTTLACSATSTGGTTNSTVLVHRDGTAPNTNGTRSPNANNGWNNTDVTVTFTGTDANSGIASCSSPVTITTEGSNQPAAGSCTDVAGNTDNETVNVSIDKTAPTITATMNPVPNSHGWNNSALLITYNPNDSLSGIPLLGCNPLLRLHLVGSEGANQSRTGTCSDQAGNVASVTVNFNIDLTNPTATATKSPPPNANGWNNTDVVVTFNGTDNVSGIDFCTPAATVSTEGSNQSRSGTCTDLSGRVSNTVTANNINIDKTAPGITFVSRTPANGNGWNTGNVTVTWSCSDSRSGVVSASVSQTISTQGTNQSATGICTDRAGNTSSNTQSGINIDWTNPTLNLPSNITEEATGPSGATVNYNASASDNLDATPTVVCTPVSGDTYPLGTTVVNCTATDDAGNSTSGSFSVTVQDTTAPVIAVHADITKEATSAAGNIVTYTSPSTSDAVDGPGIASCLPASGSTFPVGDTTVTCDASDTQENAATPTTFVVHIVDTTPPTISQPADIFTDTTNNFGAIVSYLAPETFDIVDGTSVATCEPPSGSKFPVGETTVICTITDAHKNSASIKFTIHVAKKKVTTTITSDFFIPETGGSSVKLNCVAPNSFNIRMVGARIIFNNLCDHEAFINHLQQPELPGELPNGFELIDGYTININKDGKPVNPLPDNSSVAIEFNIPNAQENADFGVLYWDGSQWTEISGEMTDDGLFLIDITATLANSNTFIFVTK